MAKSENRLSTRQPAPLPPGTSSPSHQEGPTTWTVEDLWNDQERFHSQTTSLDMSQRPGHMWVLLWDTYFQRKGTGDCPSQPEGRVATDIHCQMPQPHSSSFSDLNSCLASQDSESTSRQQMDEEMWKICAAGYDSALNKKEVLSFVTSQRSPEGAR